MSEQSEKKLTPTQEARKAKRQWIIELYQSGLNLQQVGEKVGMSKQAVYQHLKAAGVERRMRGGNTHGGSRHA